MILYDLHWWINWNATNIKPVVYKKFMPYVEGSWIIYFSAPESGPQANRVKQIN